MLSTKPARLLTVRHSVVVKYCVLFDHFLSTIGASVCLTIHLPGFERVLPHSSNQVATALTNFVVVHVNSSEPLSFIAKFLCG